MSEVEEVEVVAFVVVVVVVAVVVVVVVVPATLRPNISGQIISKSEQSLAPMIAIGTFSLNESSPFGRSDLKKQFELSWFQLKSLQSVVF
jgi:hypothetical protein